MVSRPGRRSFHHQHGCEAALHGAYSGHNAARRHVDVHECLYESRAVLFQLRYTGDVRVLVCHAGAQRLYLGLDAYVAGRQAGVTEFEVQKGFAFLLLYSVGHGQNLADGGVVDITYRKAVENLLERFFAYWQHSLFGFRKSETESGQVSVDHGLALTAEYSADGIFDFLGFDAGEWSAGTQQHHVAGAYGGHFLGGGVHVEGYHVGQRVELGQQRFVLGIIGYVHKRSGVGHHGAAGA